MVQDARQASETAISLLRKLLARRINKLDCGIPLPSERFSAAGKTVSLGHAS
jgi:hypothetical protein